MSIDGQKDKQNVLYTYNGILFSFERNEILIHATTWTNLEDILLREINRIQKDKYCMIPLSVRPLEQSDTQRQIVEQWLPGAGGTGNEESLFTGFRVSAWNDEKVLEVDNSDGCTTM